MLEVVIAEKITLEELTGREIFCVSLHGRELIGELIKDNTPAPLDVIPNAGFLYIGSFEPTPYCFPYRLQRQAGTFEPTYRIHANFGDIRMWPSNRYAEDFYNEGMHQVKIASQHNGVLVMMLHPIYFGVLPYLLNFENFVKLFIFMPAYLNRLVRSGK